MEIELTSFHSWIFLVRMLVFLVLCVDHDRTLQADRAAFSPPPTLICAVLLIGIILSFRQIIRLYPEVAWVIISIADPGLAIDRHPTPLAPMAASGGERSGRMTHLAADHAAPARSHRHASDERDISRYMTGLLVFSTVGTFGA
jgi:hypothetical protein